MTKKRPHIVLCGACMSGNIGGPAMYVSFAEAFQKKRPESHISVLSKYPLGDKKPCETRGWKMHSLTTWTQLFIGVPLGIFALLLKFFSLPFGWLYRGPFTPYYTGTVLVDMAGISFSGYRSFSSLVINCLWFVPALATRIPIVKLSQAVGPFQQWHVRYAARYFLGRMRIVVCRGDESERNVRNLLAQHKEIHIETLPDSAFCLRPASRESAETVLRMCGLPDGDSYIAFGPSHVVETGVRRRSGGSLYTDSMVASAEWVLNNTSCHIVFLAHEMKNGTQSDLPICEIIREQLSIPERAHLVPFTQDPRLAKAICANAQIAVGSRFHFLVATVSSGVPSLAIAWSHKYLEMMRMLGQEDMVLPYEQISPEVLRGKTSQLWAEKETRTNTIKSMYPEVETLAEKNAGRVHELLARLGK